MPKAKRFVDTVFIIMILSLKLSVFIVLTVFSGVFSVELGNIDTPVDYSLANIKESDVTFTHYKGSATDKEVFSPGNKIQSKTGDVIVIIHGFNENGHLDWVLKMIDAYLKHSPYNIIVVDWSRVATNYELAASNTRKLGEYIGKFIIDSKISLSRTQIVGSCLGGQAAGQAAKYIKKATGKKVHRISGLDVAAHKFEGIATPLDHKLRKTDTDFLDITHTNARNWGFKAPFGHVDFYPNYGSTQPGCPTDNEAEENSCSHYRVNYLFLESITKKVKTVNARIVIDLGIITLSRISNGKEVTYGQWCGEDARGVYIFKTNSTAPYLTENSTNGLCL